MMLTPNATEQRLTWLSKQFWPNLEFFRQTTTRSDGHSLQIPQWPPPLEGPAVPQRT